MAKITLGKRPKSFKRKLTIPMLDGTDATIEVSYVYRTRTEFGAFVDELFTAAGVQPSSQADEDVKFSLEAALQRTRDTNADYILKIADGWDLDIAYSRDAVVQMCDELPGAALQIIDAYRLAVTEGRLGN
jgi:Phage tail assembly chaperone